MGQMSRNAEDFLIGDIMFRGLEDFLICVMRFIVVEMKRI